MKYKTNKIPMTVSRGESCSLQGGTGNPAKIEALLLVLTRNARSFSAQRRHGLAFRVGSPAHVFLACQRSIRGFTRQRSWQPGKLACVFSWHLICAQELFAAALQRGIPHPLSGICSNLHSLRPKNITILGPDQSQMRIRFNSIMLNGSQHLISCNMGPCAEPYLHGVALGQIRS